MTRKNIYIILLVFMALISAFESFAQEERRYVRRGIEHLNDEDYIKAEAEFREALRHNPNSFEAGYNLATTLFRLERYDDAIEQLQAIAPYTDDKEQIARLYHNLGNSYLYNQDINNSIEAYKESLRQNPDDDETRYNLIAAQKLKEEQEQQQEQQQEEQQDQEEQEQEQEQQEQEQEQQEQEDVQDQESEGISRETAERLLQAVAEDEKEIMEKIDRHQEQQQIMIEKNW